MKKLPYGKLGIDIPEILYSDNCDCDFFTLPDSTMNKLSDTKLERQRILQALASPVEYTPIRKWIKEDDKVVIIIPDITRKCPVQLVLENLIPEIEASNPKEILIIIATGTHIAVTDDEKKGLVGKIIMNKYTVINHDCDGDCTYIGNTSSANKVMINSNVVKANKVFLIGSANFHCMAGFSGGRKSILPGVSARETIMYMHKRMVGEKSLHEKAKVGILEGNPLHETWKKLCIYLARRNCL